VLARELVLVAIEAIVEAVVVKGDLIPVLRIVADRTLAWIVRLLFFLQRVARLTIGKDRMIERGILPIVDVVTIGALAGVVIFWIVILEVAGPAVVKVCMIKVGILPVRGIAVAVHTGIRISPHAKKRVPRRACPLWPPPHVPHSPIRQDIVTRGTIG
jgi:hypothetical protein